MNHSRYLASKQTIEALREKVERERTLLLDEVARHLERTPLTWDTQQSLLADAKEGIVFCCQDGYRNLVVRLGDIVWIDVINAWAYDRLGCKGAREYDYDAKFRELFESTARFESARELVEDLL